MAKLSFFFLRDAFFDVELNNRHLRELKKKNSLAFLFQFATLISLLANDKIQFIDIEKFQKG